MERIEKIERAILIIGLLFLPLVFSPSILSSFETPKLLFVAIFLSLVLLICSLKMAVRGSLSLKLTNLDLPVILLALTYLFSGILKTPSKVEAFFIPGIASTIILGAMLFLLFNSLFPENKKGAVGALFISGVASSVISLLAMSGILVKVTQLPEFLKNPLFSTFGGKLPETIFIVSILPLGISLLIEEKQSIKKLFWGVCLGVLGLNALLSVYKMLPGKPAAPLLTPYSVSWSIAIDTLKESPILGIGPGNYLSAFNRFRPISYNTTNLWSLKFNTARSFLLTSISEVGLLGFAILVFIFYGIYKMFKSSRDWGVLVSLGLFAVSLVIFPFYLTTILPFFILLSLSSKKHSVDLNLRLAGGSGFSTGFPAIVFALIAIGAISASAFFAAKFTLAEYKFSQVINAVGKNDGKLAYNTILKAISLNSRVDKYHASFSQLDMALANSIAQKKNLSDQERTTITQLIQQAITEAKAAVSINPQRAGSWENLAKIYQSIMAFAQGADNFTVQAYNQAVALDPINPNLRIALGGAYYALGRYDEAISTFQLAILAKPDLANAHYNLAAAYREKGDINKAISEMNTVLTQVTKDSADYNLAKAELESLQKKLPAAKTTGTTGESLTPPAEAPKQVIKPPLELPKEATPPATP